MRLTKGGEADAADAADAAAATTVASTASTAAVAAAASADQEKWFWHADSKPVCLSLFLSFPSPILIMLEVGGKQEVEGEASTLDVTAFTLATLFRTVPVDEWYNQRSRGTPVLDEDGRE
ncbi:hypothetical protein ALC53_04479 [Atta colombica]|uniref:Uncharacterized protein n=1 Tax=Atta colombica TaxID=520822 RepID=A0A195BK84_9HYME|nr:hypothetical protein ALC53_04479 [Atta colombica]